jgi:hypothetical protein
MLKDSYIRLFSLGLLAVLLVSFACIYNPKSSTTVEAALNWLSGWPHRKSHVINSSAGAGQDYQTCIKVYKGTGVDGSETLYGVPSGKVFLGSNVRDDFGDVRFTAADGTTELKYWLQEYALGTSAVFWVKVADSLESSSATIHVYYGNPPAVTTSSGSDTFVAFGDFEAGYDGWTNIDLDSFERVTSPVYRDSYSLYAKRSVVTDVPADAYKSVTFPSDYAYHVAFRINGTSELEISAYASGTTGYQNGVRLYPYGGAFRYKLGDTSSVSCNVGYSVNTWYLGQIRRTGTGTWELAYYDAAGTTLWEKTDISYSPTLAIDRLGISPENNNDLYIDNTFVRKYTSSANEPAHTLWGNEETEVIAKLAVTPTLVERNNSDIGSTFSLNVTIQNVTDLFGFDYNLTWDSSLLTIENVDFNAALDAIWGLDNWFVASNHTGPGYYKLAVVSILSGFDNTETVTLTTLTIRSEDPLSNFMRNTSLHFDTHKLSDSKGQPMDHIIEDGTYRIAGKKPTLQFSPTAKTCRTYGECLLVKVNISDAFNLTGFKFEIDFNTTILDYAGIAWNAWGTGSISVDEGNGNITGFTSGSMLNDNLTLISVEFNATCHHIWKNITGWINDQSGTVLIQWANLSYPDSTEIGYLRGGFDQINVGSDVLYTFAPIQGDVNNDGSVDIFDLRTVAYYYDQNNDTYNLTGSNIIDVFDLVIVGSNFGFTYP